MARFLRVDALAICARTIQASSRSAFAAPARLVRTKRVRAGASIAQAPARSLKCLHAIFSRVGINTGLFGSRRRRGNPSVKMPCADDQFVGVFAEAVRAWLARVCAFARPPG